MKITKSQLQKIIKEEMDFMRRRIITGDPVGVQEAIDVRDFLEETHALHFSYKGLNDLEAFLVAPIEKISNRLPPIDAPYSVVSWFNK